MKLKEIIVAEVAPRMTITHYEINAETKFKKAKPSREKFVYADTLQHLWCSMCVMMTVKRQSRSNAVQA